MTSQWIGDVAMDTIQSYDQQLGSFTYDLLHKNCFVFVFVFCLIN